RWRGLPSSSRRRRPRGCGSAGRWPRTRCRAWSARWCSVAACAGSRPGGCCSPTTWRAACCSAPYRSPGSPGCSRRRDRPARDRRCAGDAGQLRARARPGRAHLRVPRRARRPHPTAGVGARLPRRPGGRLGGVIYGPFVALSVTLMQAKSPPQHLAAMLAARSAVLLTASPLGTAVGGPLTTALGPRATLGGSGLATVGRGAVARGPRLAPVVLGAVACVLLLARRRNQQAREPGVLPVQVRRMDYSRAEDHEGHG